MCTLKLIAIGDNVTDCYVDEGVYFPGGNAVNVAVNCKKCGAEKVNYIGVFGDDDRADYIRECLAEVSLECLAFHRVLRSAILDAGLLVHSEDCRKKWVVFTKNQGVVEILEDIPGDL